VTKLVFHVQGSAPEPYVVIIERVGNNVRATCDCPAGAAGLHCKHRFSLFDGDARGIVSGNELDASRIPEMLFGTDVAAAFEALKAAQQQEEETKRRVQNAKRALVRAMSN
jgi:hypothetical protein